MTPPVIIPAETIQAEDHPDHPPVISPAFGFGLLALVAAVAGAHVIWVMAGMPGPSEILAKATEMLNV